MQKFVAWVLRAIALSVFLLCAIPVLIGLVVLVVSLIPFMIMVAILAPVVGWSNGVLGNKKGSELYFSLLNKIKRNKETTVH